MTEPYPALHGPHRPSWNCTACPEGTAWPCDERKAQLRELFGGHTAGIQVYMLTYALTAQDELGLTYTEMELRFFRWTGPFRNEARVSSASLRALASNAKAGRYWPGDEQ